MGNLTEDIARLCNEIIGLRESRLGFMNTLTRAAKERGQAVAQMQANIRTALGEMAHEGKANRTAFASNVRKAVSGLVQTVADLRQGFVTDVEGARKAWFGLSPDEGKTDAQPTGGRTQPADENAESHTGKARKTKKVRK